MCPTIREGLATPLDIMAADNDQEDPTMDTTVGALDEVTALHDPADEDETETPDNPFLRTPKRMKLKL